VGEEHRHQADGLGAEFLAQQAVAGGGLVALVEQQVERGEHTVEPGREVLALGNLEGDAGLVDALLGARQLFLDGRLAAEEGAGDLGGAETADHLQREDDLRVRRDGGMATDEQQAQRVVADRVGGLPRDGRARDGLLVVGDDGRFLAGGHALATEVVLGEIHGHLRDPRGGIGRHAAHGPGAQRAQHGLLDHILGERQVVDAEQAEQGAVQAAGLVPEEVLDQLGGLPGCDWRGVGHQAWWTTTSPASLGFVFTPRWQVGVIWRTSMMRP